jgi:Domain of unknown function (DUF929)
LLAFEMRARVKRRQLYRRVTIIVIITAVVLTLVLGFYFVYKEADKNGALANQPVTAGDFSTLRQLSLASYGPSGASLLSTVKAYTGTSFTSNGKPLVVYIGADYCPFCAIQRWPLIMALMRFGNFSGLKYMAASLSEGDYPTFTFHGTAYHSQYLVFQGFEQQSRQQGVSLDTVPSNYTGVFGQYGSSYPFIDFGNKYIVSGAMIPPEGMGNDDWTDVFNGIKTNSSLGIQIKESTNVITALICKLTSNVPNSVCSQPQISELSIQISGYVPGSLGLTSGSSGPAVATVNSEQTDSGRR